MKGFIFGFAILLAWPASAQETGKPLPELKNFLEEFQVKRPGLYKPLMGENIDPTGQYTYTETCTETKLDSSGKAKSSEMDVYEIIPTGKPFDIFRRKTVKAGIPLSQRELDKQDREFMERMAKQQAEAEKRKSETQAKPKQEPPPNPPKQESMFLALYDFQMVGRETLDGRPVIRLTFKPKPGYTPQNTLAKMLQHVIGSAWVSEDDYELARVEVEVTEPITFGGILARIRPGSKAAMEWRKFNDEVWLPYKREFVANARLLLLKGMHEHESSEFSGFRKYSVDTKLKFHEK